MNPAEPTAGLSSELHSARLHILYGWVMGWQRLKTGSILAPVLLHVAINGTAMTVLFLTRSGT